MASVWANKGGDEDPNHNQNQRDVTTQLVISIALGLFAFLGFCFLRPRWTGLYAARKRRKNSASSLPELPDGFFGWLPVLYRISEEEVLASAGLDAFVFLSFFRLATKYIAVVFFFSLVVLLPVHVHESGDYGMPQPQPGNSTTSSMQVFRHSAQPSDLYQDQQAVARSQQPTDPMLWVYLCFVYFFSGLLLYLIVTETKKIIRIRQDYLGSQSTVTDRTIRLSGIPEKLRSEEMIKETIENLQIGKVESVLLCKDWEEIDNLMNKRMTMLRKLEEAWTVYLGKPGRANYTAPQNSANPDDEASSRLLNGQSHDQSTQDAERPKSRIWYGFLGLQSRSVDAIDYYEEKLRRLDEQIKSSRNKVFKPMPIAFVTLDSTAAAQMAIQATMDPEPMTLLAKPAPAPSDVVWQNTYISRTNRMLRAWSISLVIALLTIFWSLLLYPLAGLLSLENIGKVWPQLHDALDSHKIARSLVQQGLPTLIISLLTVAVPYLYYWLSTLQGMISQGEVEMSLISKNFFFTFFNLFVVFTIFGTGLNANAARYRDKLGDSLKDTTTIAYTLAKSLKDLVLLYMNLIILQGLGLFPLRLLEFGSVALYPISLIGAKTPRDYAEMVQPPVFSYGFYLPQSLLIFIICIVYSVLPASWFVLFFGLVYFIIGHFIYKYQLLYAMDHRRHSTGRAWPLICNRIVLGLLVFQLAMAGILGLNLAFYRSALIVPLIVFSIWFLVYYQRTYAPLMRFIAIRSLTHDPPFGAVPPGESRYESETSRGRDVDEDDESGLRYINPNLILPLEDVWLAKKPTDTSGQNGTREDREDV
ncbi:hypothetical protein ACLMJK_005755 [Lecanora helva]